MNLRRLVGFAGVVLAMLIPAASVSAATPNGAVFYVVTSGNLYTYQIGTWAQTSHTTLPFSGNVRGSEVDLSRDSLYIAYGGHGGTSGNGSLLRYNLVTGSVVWNKHFTHGVDQPGICGGKIYLPAGSGANTTTVYVLDAGTGAQLGTITGGSHPHNTLCHNGIVYNGGEGSSYLYIHGGSVSRVGPGPKTGVRPFTVNAADTRAYITWSSWRGYSVGDLTTGKILKTVSFGTQPTTADLPVSHGISMNPAGTEVYVLDKTAQTVRVYGSGDTAPHLADVKLKDTLTGNESQCPEGSCTREGWLLHSLNGRYVFVGDSGDVIDTSTRTITGYIPALRNCRHGYLEVDWSNGQPVATSTRFGTGH